jgi:hypothetical protein
MAMGSERNVAGQMGQDILDRNPRKEDLGQDIWHKTSLTGHTDRHLGQDNWERTAETGRTNKLA